MDVTCQWASCKSCLNFVTFRVSMMTQQWLYNYATSNCVYSPHEHRVAYGNPESVLIELGMSKKIFVDKQWDQGWCWHQIHHIWQLKANDTPVPFDVLIVVFWLWLPPLFFCDVFILYAVHSFIEVSKYFLSLKMYYTFDWSSSIKIHWHHFMGNKELDVEEVMI